jgi:hypothetical protein
MVRRQIIIEVKTSVAVGADQNVADLVDKWAQISGTFTATIDIEGSLDGTNWITLMTISSAALLNIPQSLSHIRTNTTAYTSGTPSCILAGRDARTA